MSFLLFQIFDLRLRHKILISFSSDLESRYFSTMLLAFNSHLLTFDLKMNVYKKLLIRCCYTAFAWNMSSKLGCCFRTFFTSKNLFLGRVLNVSARIFCALLKERPLFFCFIKYWDVVGKLIK